MTDPWDRIRTFSYMKTIKINHSHVGKYTSPMDPMGIPKKQTKDFWLLKRTQENKQLSAISSFSPLHLPLFALRKETAWKLGT